MKFVSMCFSPRYEFQLSFPDGLSLPAYRLIPLIHRHKINYVYVRGMNTIGCIQMLKQLQPDVIITNAGKVGKSVLGIPKIGVLNAHNGLLPEYRGNDAIGWSILNGDKVGVTVHLMDEGYDTGPILMKRAFEYCNSHTHESLHYEITCLRGAEMLAEAILLVDSGNYVIEPQVGGKYWPGMTEEQKQAVTRYIKHRNC